MTLDYGLLIIQSMQYSLIRYRQAGLSKTSACRDAEHLSPIGFTFLRQCLLVLVFATLGSTSLLRGASADPLDVDWEALAPCPAEAVAPPQVDWLISRVNTKAGVYRGKSQGEIIMANGLLSRTFAIRPNGATVAITNLMRGVNMARAIKPEALLTIDNQQYTLGGLAAGNTNTFQLVHFEVSEPQSPIIWKRVRHASAQPWPPKGVRLRMDYELVGQSLRASIFYELYQGLPVLGKWLTLQNDTSRTVVLDSMIVDILALGSLDQNGQLQVPPFEMFSEYTFGGDNCYNADHTTSWRKDPEFTGHQDLSSMVVSQPTNGPWVRLVSGATFESYRNYLLLQAHTLTSNAEGYNLTIRRFYRYLSPWATENPTLVATTTADRTAFRSLVDQCVDIGFEMVLLSWTCNWNMENENPDYLANIKADVDYAHSKGIEVGAYSLFSSRHISDQDDVINPKTGKPGGTIFGYAPCMGSTWGSNYIRKLKNFITATGVDHLDHDGPYPGDICASTTHPGHYGQADSQWQQWKISAEFYAWCRARGVHLSVPDVYLLTGAAKMLIGYVEDNWGLPREQQILLGRKYIYDGTSLRTPSMGWTFVPLEQYKPASDSFLEPLQEHLDIYNAILRNNFSGGVQAYHFGRRLYDTEQTRQVVKYWVTWFKQHRDILESDIIHIRRPDGADFDGFIHVNPDLPERGLAVLFNPLSIPITRSVKLPLYYTGLKGDVFIHEYRGNAKKYLLGADGAVTVPVTIPANDFTWLLITPSDILHIRNLNQQGELTVENSFTNGTMTVEKAFRPAGPWQPETTVCSTALTTRLNVALGATQTFYRVVLTNLATGN